MTKYQKVINEIDAFCEQGIITVEEAIEMHVAAYDKYYVEGLGDTYLDAKDKENEIKNNQLSEKSNADAKKIAKYIAIATASVLLGVFIMKEVKKRKLAKEKAICEEIEKLNKQSKELIKDMRKLMLKRNLSSDEVNKLKDSTRKVESINSSLKAMGKAYKINIEPFLRHYSQERIDKKIAKATKK